MPERRRKPFFLFFMFTGMGVGFILMSSLGGLGFTAAMFIGMGLGFLADSVLTVEEAKIKAEVPVKAGGAVMTVIGVLLIAVGGLLLFSPSLLEAVAPYVIGLGFIAAGVYLMLVGTRVIKAARA